MDKNTKENTTTTTLPKEPPTFNLALNNFDVNIAAASIAATTDSVIINMPKTTATATIVDAQPFDAADYCKDDGIERPLFECVTSTGCKAISKDATLAIQRKLKTMDLKKLEVDEHSFLDKDVDEYTKYNEQAKDDDINMSMAMTTMSPPGVKKTVTEKILFETAATNVADLEKKYENSKNYKIIQIDSPYDLNERKTLFDKGYACVTFFNKTGDESVQHIKSLKDYTSAEIEELKKLLDMGLEKVNLDEKCMFINYDSDSSSNDELIQSIYVCKDDDGGDDDDDDDEDDDNDDDDSSKMSNKDKISKLKTLNSDKDVDTDDIDADNDDDDDDDDEIIGYVSTNSSSEDEIQFNDALSDCGHDNSSADDDEENDYDYDDDDDECILSKEYLDKNKPAATAPPLSLI